MCLAIPAVRWLRQATLPAVTYNASNWKRKGLESVPSHPVLIVILLMSPEKQAGRLNTFTDFFFSQNLRQNAHFQDIQKDQWKASKVLEIVRPLSSLYSQVKC